MAKAYLEPQEVEMIVKAARCVRDMLLILLLFYLGCRISELLALEVKDIDFANATVTIQHLKQRLKLLCLTCGARLGRSHIYCPGCGSRVAETVKRYEEHHRMRTLPLNDDILNMLRQFIDNGGPVLKDGKQLIFGMNRYRAWQIITECAWKAQLPQIINPETGKAHYISPHRLRDSFAVHAVKVDDTGDGLRLLQEHLGHQSITTTMRYRKVAGEEHLEWYKRLWDGDKP